MIAPAEKSDKVADHPRKHDVPVLRLNMQADIGNGRIAVLETYLPQDEPAEAIDALMDKMGKAADRQKSKHQIIAIEAEIATDQKMLDQAREDEQRCRNDWEAAFAVDTAEHQLLEEDYAKAARAEQDGWRKHGDFEASSKLRKRANDVARGLTELQKKKAAHDAEVGNFATTVKRWESEIARKRGEIERLQALVG